MSATAECITATLFLSSPSIRRATTVIVDDGVPTVVSILALHTEGDVNGCGPCQSRGVFLSSPSIRRATLELPQATSIRAFLSSPSIRRATAAALCLLGLRRFLSSPSIRRAT